MLSLEDASISMKGFWFKPAVMIAYSIHIGPSRLAEDQILHFGVLACAPIRKIPNK